MPTSGGLAGIREESGQTNSGQPVGDPTGFAEYEAYEADQRRGASRHDQARGVDQAVEHSSQMAALAEQLRIMNGRIEELNQKDANAGPYQFTTGGAEEWQVDEYVEQKLRKDAFWVNPDGTPESFAQGFVRDKF